MSTKKISIIFIIMYTLVYTVSCKFVDFARLEVSCSVPENNGYFLEDEVEIDFSLLPDKESLKELIVFQRDTSSVDFEMRLEGNKAFVKPVEPWQRGVAYSIGIQGELKLDAGGSHSVHFYRIFFYGAPSKKFGLLKWTEPTASERGPLVLEFVSPISIPGFSKSFSLTPQIPFDFYVEKNGCQVLVVPQEAWTKNQRFKWVLNQFEDVDGYLLDKQYQGNFIWDIDTVIPCVEKVAPVLSVVDNDLIVYAQDSGLLFDNQSILLRFSKEMDFDSVKNGVSIEPNIAGELQRCSSGKDFLWVPEENWSLEKEYRLIVSHDVKDLSGNQLTRNVDHYFTVANRFLQVTSIQLGEETPDAGEGREDGGNALEDGTDTEGYNFQSGSLKKIAITDEKSTVITRINFSQPLGFASLQNDLGTITMEPLFPITANYPILEKVSYDKNSGLSLYWSGFSPSSDDVTNYYRLEISGGTSGLKTDAGNYLEEDVCLIIQIL